MSALPPGLMAVEAMQFDGTQASGDEIGAWVSGKGQPCKVHVQGDGDPEFGYVEFPYKDSKLGSPLYHCRASVGQWIIFGPHGFERWTQAQFERVFHRVSVGDVSVNVPRLVGGESAAERLAQDIVGEGL